MSHQNKLVLTAKLRRPKVAKMYLEGMTQREIGEHFGVAHTTIGNDLKIIKDLWIENAKLPFDEAMGKVMARIDWMEREAVREWIESKDDKKADTQYLKVVQWCVEQRIKLFGLTSDAPTVQINQQVNNHFDDQWRRALLEVYGDD